MTIVNNTMSTGVQVPFRIGVFVFFFLDMYPGMEFLGNMVALVLVFCETSILFHTGALMYIPTNSTEISSI